MDMNDDSKGIDNNSDSEEDLLGEDETKDSEDEQQQQLWSYENFNPVNLNNLNNNPPATSSSRFNFRISKRKVGNYGI